MRKKKIVDLARPEPKWTVFEDTDRFYGEELRELLKIVFPGKTFDSGYPLGRQAKVFLVTVRGEIAGTCSYTRGRLNWLAVHPKWRRKGIGKALIKKVIEEHSRTTPYALRVRLNPADSKSERLYRKCGFVDDRDPLV